MTLALMDSRANTDKLASAFPIVDEIMAISGVPGLSIGIANQGKVAGTYHFGYRDIGAGVRPNDQTRYNINSLTKGILSALVGIEIFNNPTRLNWHDPIRTILLTFYRTGAVYQASTTCGWELTTFLLLSA